MLKSGQILKSEIRLADVLGVELEKRRAQKYSSISGLSNNRKNRDTIYETGEVGGGEIEWKQGFDSGLRTLKCLLSI